MVILTRGTFALALLSVLVVLFSVGLAQLILIDPQVHWKIKLLSAICKGYFWWIGASEGSVFNREHADLLYKYGEIPATNVSINELHVPSHLDHFPIPVSIFSPFDEEERPRKLPILLYFHGGGFVIGSGHFYKGILQKFSSEAAVLVISVDYRRAPEHSFPIPLEDCYSVLRWIRNEGRHIIESSKYGGDVSRVILAGDSAGGNLAATLAYLSRDRNKTKNEFPGLSIIQQILIYPCIIPVFQKTDALTESMREHQNGYIINLDLMLWFWNQYIPSRQINNSSYINPLLGQPNGLPPALILTAELDVLRDEANMYYKYLLESSVPAQLHHYNSVHGFFTIEDIPEAQHAYSLILHNLRRLHSNTI